MVKVGDKVHLGQGALWEGHYEVLEVRQNFKNGKISVVVNFKGKKKVFHLE